MALSHQLCSYGTCGQCRVVMGPPHQRPRLYCITCIDHSCHTFTVAEESNIVHLVTVRWAFLHYITRIEHSCHAFTDAENLTSFILSRCTGRSCSSASPVSCVRYHDILNGALTQIRRIEQCQVVLRTPHQGPEAYYITRIYHSWHAFTVAEEPSVVHLVMVC